MDKPRSNLPSATQIRLAIGSYWKGGGTANLIVNVCRREMASISEAEELGRQLAERANRGWNHFTDEQVVEHLEAVRAVGQISKDKELQEAKSPTPPIGSPEWHRRASERALRSRELFGGEEGYRKQLSTWKWERPAKQRKVLG